MATINGRFTCDNCYAVYLGDSNGVTQKIFPSGSDLSVVNTQAIQISNGEGIQFDANPGDWFYIIAWSDGGVKQGLLGSFKGTSILDTGDAGWEVLPTKHPLPFDASASATVPTVADINGYIAAASPGDWKIPSVGPDYNHSSVIYGAELLSAAFKAEIAVLGVEPKWVWYDSGKDTSGSTIIPFEGFNHDEFLIFRFPLRLIAPSGSSCAEGQGRALTALEALVQNKHFHLTNQSGLKNCPDYVSPVAGEKPPCQGLDIPPVKPCFYLHWGDGSRDQIETEDFEVAILSVCNQYSNLTFKNLTITDIEVVHADGRPVELLPDGTPSVFCVPSKMLSVCSLAPCTCTHFELAIKSDGALEGLYKIRFKYCIEGACFTYSAQNSAEFNIELITS